MEYTTEGLHFLSKSEKSKSVFDIEFIVQNNQTYVGRKSGDLFYISYQDLESFCEINIKKSIFGTKILIRDKNLNKTIEFVSKQGQSYNNKNLFPYIYEMNKASRRLHKLCI